MRLAAQVAGPIDLDGAVAGVLDERLRRDSARPLAVALSGGGDSVALLLAADAWAKRAGRPLLVLTVDHRLSPQSAGWTQACAARARALGHAFKAVAWEGPKPATGLPAAARAARHRLLADAARAAGARVILMGHTADDVREAAAMRAAGSSTPGPRPWSPSPVWPQGRGLFLLRPLLGVRREAIRAWLAARGERWVEDPANADPRFARARARMGLDRDLDFTPPETPAPKELADACAMDAAGMLTIARDRLRACPEAARVFVGGAVLCAAGGARPPLPARLDRLTGRLLGAEDVAATLSGARIEADGDAVRFLREPGEAARGGLVSQAAQAGEVLVWDGRFEILAHRHMEIRALRGLAARLPEAERQALRAVPARARPALPVGVDAGAVSCLALDPAHCRPLALERLQAACGLVEREPG